MPTTHELIIPGQTFWYNLTWGCAIEARYVCPGSQIIRRRCVHRSDAPLHPDRSPPQHFAIVVQLPRRSRLVVQVAPPPYPDRACGVETRVWGQESRQSSTKLYTRFGTQVWRTTRQIRSRLPEGRPLPAPVWERRHRGILILLWLHAIGIVCFGILASLRDNAIGTPVTGFVCYLSARALDIPIERIPLAWVADGLFQYLLDGGLIALAAFLASLANRSRRFRAAVASIGLITASAVLVHLAGGIIEMHFHFFVALIVISLYQDWLPFLLAIGYVVVEHGVLGTLAPAMVYNHPDAWLHPWRWAAIHGGFCVGRQHRQPGELATQRDCSCSNRAHPQLRRRWHLRRRSTSRRHLHQPGGGADVGPSEREADRPASMAPAGPCIGRSDGRATEPNVALPSAARRFSSTRHRRAILP